MLTMPQRSNDPYESTSNNFARLKLYVRAKDIHKWIIGKETGQGGYEHLQVRLRTNSTFDELKEWFPDAHIEEASDTWEYERKEGRYITAEDTTDILKVRFGEPRDYQKEWLRCCEKQGDRGITVVYDRAGNAGKSWLCNYLFETGRGYYVSPHQKSAIGIIQDIAAGYRGEGMAVIDIPRTWQWSDDLYTCIESIKDGLVKDPRYHPNNRNIRGVKLLIYTNTMPQLDKLSKDRWKIIRVIHTEKGIKNIKTWEHHLP